MDRNISKPGVALLLAVTAFAIGLFLYLVPRFGGPDLTVSGERYEAVATFGDALGLEKSGDVMVRGVRVGTVRRLRVHGDRVTIRIAIDARYAPLGRDATIRLGQKTPLGESFVDLMPGRPRTAGALRSGGEITRVLPTVTPSEALRALDPAARARLQAALGTFAEGAAAPEARKGVHDALTGTADLVHELRGIAETLRAQDRDVAALVTDGRTALGALGSRERSLARVVSGGAATLHAIAAQQGATRALLRRLPGMLATTRAALDEARPLVLEARPAVADLRRAAPRVTSVLRRLGPVSDDADAVLVGLRPFNRVLLPVLRRALPTIDAARPSVRSLTRTLAELVPVARYTNDRRSALTAWFSGTRASVSSGDEHGAWYRFNIFAEPGTAFGMPGTVQSNPYTKPGDALSNQPYRRGDYPRLMPYPAGR